MTHHLIIVIIYLLILLLAWSHHKENARCAWIARIIRPTSTKMKWNASENEAKQLLVFMVYGSIGISEYITFVCVCALCTRPKHFQFYFVIIYFISFLFSLAHVCIWHNVVCKHVKYARYYVSQIYTLTLCELDVFIYWMLYCTMYTSVV